MVMCPSSVVRLASSTISLNIFSSKTAGPILDQTWQECSLGGPFEKLLTEFDSIENSCCHGNEIEFFKQFLKSLLLRNRWSDFEIISQECSLGDPFKKLFAKF